MAKKQKQEQKKKKRVIWSPLVVTLLSATTLTSTGLAVYFALRKQTAKTYTITVKLGQGEVIYGGSTQHMMEGTLIGQIPTPYKDNQVFDYWDDAVTNQKLNPSAKITHDMTIRPVYKDVVDSVSVTLHLNGGHIPGFPETTDTKTLLIKKDTYIGELPAPQMSNYIFSSWQTISGQEYDSKYKIGSDMDVYAGYAPTTGSYIDGKGSRLLQFKNYAKASDSNKWTLYDSQKIEVSGANWEIYNKTDKKAIPGVTISDGLVSWDGTATAMTAGEYTAVISAVKGDVKAETDISIVISNAEYTIEGYSSIVTNEGETPKLPTYKLKKDTAEVTTGISWSLGTGAPDGLTIPNGVLTWAKGKIKPSIYNFDVIATYDSKQTKFPITFACNSVDSVVEGGPSDSISIYNDRDAGSISTTPFTFKNGTETIADVVWDIDEPSKDVGIAIGKSGDDMLLFTGVNGVTAGTYPVVVTATYTTGYTDKKIASKTVTLVSKRHTYALKDGSNYATGIVGKDGTAGKAWHIYKDGGSAPMSTSPTISWSVTKSDGAKAPDGVIVNGGTLEWTTATPKGTYDLIIKATIASTKSLAQKEEATIPVTLEIVDHTYAISGGSTVLTGKLGAAGADTNAWKLMQDGTTEITTGVTWTVTKADTAKTAITWASIKNNKLEWTDAAPLGKNDLLVTATLNTSSYSANVSLVVEDNSYVWTEGTSSFVVKSTDEGVIGAKAWGLTKDGTDVTDKLSIENINPTLPADSSITIATSGTNIGKVTCTKIPAGTHTFDVAYKVNGAIITSKPCSVVSTETFEIKYGDGTKGSSFTVKDSDTAANSSEFSLYKNGGTSAESSVTWGVKSISPALPTGSTIAFDTASGKENTLLCKTVAKGTYSMTIEATQKSEVVASIPFTVVSEDTQIKLQIIGEDTINFDNGLKYEFSTNSARTNIEWTTSWSSAAGGDAPDTKTITETGHLQVTLKNVSIPMGTLTLKAKDTDSGLTAEKQVQIQMPYQNSKHVWSHNNQEQWSVFDGDSLIDAEADIKYYVVGSDAPTTKSRASYDTGQIYIGTEIISIPDNFLINCKGLTDTLVAITPQNMNSKTMIIGNNFMKDCTNFKGTGNSSGGVYLYNTKIQIIGDGFMKGCTSFIGDGKMESPGSSITLFVLPDGLTYIGDQFLWNCKAFDQGITIPSSVTSVGESFMYNCYNFGTKLSEGKPVANVYIANDPLCFKAQAAIPLTFACDDSSQKCFSQGIYVVSAGTQASELKEIFPAIEPAAAGDVCRKYYA